MTLLRIIIIKKDIAETVQDWNNGVTWIGQYDGGGGGGGSGDTCDEISNNTCKQFCTKQYLDIATMALIHYKMEGLFHPVVKG